MSTDEFGRERVQFFEILQPKCVNVYGDAAFSPPGICTAALGVTGALKCHNSKATCQDPDNYTPTDQVLLRFSRSQQDLLQYGYVLPMLESLRTTPGAINLAAMDENKSALGVREVVTVQLKDRLHDDHLVDPYRLERQTGDASLLDSGDAQAGTSDTLTLEATAPESFAGTPIVRLVAGSGSVQERPLLSFDGGTKVATVSPRWRTNAFTKSSAVDHANWTKQNGITITADFGAGPDGTVKAERVQTDGISLARYFQTVTGFAGQTVCFALKMRSLTGVDQNIALHLRETGFGTTYASQVKVVTPAWQTFSISAAIPGGSAGVMALVYDSSGVLVWDFLACEHQFNEGSTPGDFIETDAAAITLPDATTDYEIREAFDPYERGTFFGKFLARNPFYANYRCQVREGYIGQALEDMALRKYIIDRIEGPNEGAVRIVAKDLFSKLEAQKSVAPAASRGELAANISDSDTSATLSPTGIGDLDYPIPATSPPTFYVAIGDEIILTERTDDTLNFVTRGALGTTAAEHEEEDLVQLVLAYETELAHDIVYDLLTEYGGITVAQIDLADWDIKAAQITTLYTLHIAEPTPVAELVGELCQQAGFTVWHDVETDMIELAALRASAFDITIDDDAWIKDGTLTLKRQDDRRVSEVWFYYGQKNKKEELEKRDNFSSRFVAADLDAESDEEYGIPKIREVFSRGVPQFGQQAAQQGAERILSLFRNPPLQAEFSLHHSRLSQIRLGQFVGLRTSDVQDATGEMATKTMAVVEIERAEHELSVMLQEVNFFTEADDTGDREIFIENDAFNLNLRTLHDGLYGDPPEGSPSINVTFFGLDGVTVGSTSTSNPAMRTGTWSDVGIVPTLNVGAGFRIQGKGGAGGKSGQPASSRDGNAGGPALLCDDPVHITGAGDIWAGGGGGGAGAGHVGHSGGGGGGGSGTDGGAGGGVAAETFTGQNGSAGTSDAGGDGGLGGCGAGTCAGDGGDGGGPGLAGANGTQNDSAPAQPGSGGAAGSYAIDGVSLVTFDSPNLLDIRGGQIN